MFTCYLLSLAIGTRTGWDAIKPNQPTNQLTNKILLQTKCCSERIWKYRKKTNKKHKFHIREFSYFDIWFNFISALKKIQLENLLSQKHANSCPINWNSEVINKKRQTHLSDDWFDQDMYKKIWNYFLIFILYLHKINPNITKTQF